MISGKCYAPLLSGTRQAARCFTILPLIVWLFFCATALAAPKVVVISLDGATPRLINQYLEDGTLPATEGLGLLKNAGAVAKLNTTIAPSLTAPGHIAIATGSIASNTDVPSNTFHLVASPFAANISGFAAPAGGYDFFPLGESVNPTAEFMWNPLRASGKIVATATWPGSDGADIIVPGLTGSPTIQSASKRTVDYTVPFGAFAGVGAKGFSLTAADFSAAPAQTTADLAAAGHASFSQVLQKTAPLDTFSVGGQSYTIQLAMMDTTDDSAVNYDLAVFFDSGHGGILGPFTPGPLGTGPAYIQPVSDISANFYLESSSSKAGLAFYVTSLAADLSAVRLARSSANAIPRNTPVLTNVDDINNNVGFWAPQADFRIPERLSPGFTSFPDTELEAIYEDLVVTFVDYQTRVALRAIHQNPDADLVMIYIEQPDGSEHQFLLVDPRQATNPVDPNSIGANQDPAKVARYQTFVQTAYQVANNAVQNIIEAVGVDSNGVPNSDVFVVSDHGFDPFHTAVNINNLLAANGIESTKVRAVTSGPAVNLYINLQGREPDGIVTRQEYLSLRRKLAEILEDFKDTNRIYTLGRERVHVFDEIFLRPVPRDMNDPKFGLGTSQFVGQDSGDVFAMMRAGYNFDGTQSPVVQRQGDPVNAAPVLSVPNFYGAHGYDPEIRDMSAIFFAAGPDIKRKRVDEVRNIDIAPTIMHILGVAPPSTIDGRVLFKILQ